MKWIIIPIVLIVLFSGCVDLVNNDSGELSLVGTPTNNVVSTPQITSISTPQIQNNHPVTKTFHKIASNNTRLSQKIETTTSVPVKVSIRRQKIHITSKYHKSNISFRIETKTLIDTVQTNVPNHYVVQHIADNGTILSQKPLIINPAITYTTFQGGFSETVIGGVTGQFTKTYTKVSSGDTLSFDSVNVSSISVNVTNTQKYKISTAVSSSEFPYQMNLTIHSGSGTNNATDVFLNGNNATNFSDIRFVLNDTTPLAYWIEDNTTDPIKVWVNVTANGTVSMYYGNPAVTSESNGTAIFPFFDDFERPVSDTVENNWNEVGGAATDIQIISNPFGSGNVLKLRDVGNDNNNKIEHSIAQSNEFIIDYNLAHSAPNSSGSAGLRLYEGTTHDWGQDINSATSELAFFEGTTQTPVYPISANTFYKLSVHLRSDSTYDVYIDGSKEVTNQAFLANMVTGIDKIQIINYLDASLYIDNIRVRKYSAIPPTWGTWGSEQNVSSNITIGTDTSPNHNITDGAYTHTMSSIQQLNTAIVNWTNPNTATVALTIYTTDDPLQTTKTYANGYKNGTMFVNYDTNLTNVTTIANLDNSSVDYSGTIVNLSNDQNVTDIRYNSTNVIWNSTQVNTTVTHWYNFSLPVNNASVNSQANQTCEWNATCIITTSASDVDGNTINYSTTINGTTKYGENPDFSGLVAGTYDIISSVTDFNGTIGDTPYPYSNVTKTLMVSDTIAPSPITNLANTTGDYWVNWTWTNPPESDFDHIEVWINSVFDTNTSNSYFNYTALEGQTVNLELKSVDVRNNVNATTVTDSVTMNTTQINQIIGGW